MPFDFNFNSYYDFEYYKSLCKEKANDKEFLKEFKRTYNSSKLITMMIQIVCLNFSFFMPINKEARKNYIMNVVVVILGKRLHNRMSEKRRKKWNEKIKEGLTSIQNNKNGE